jgi:branched-chain amino acid transport system ATP-binding protein
MPCIRAVEVEAGYGGKKVIQGLNFKADERKITLLIGPNGSGKSTLAKLIAGILPLSKGSIFLDGENIANLRSDQRAKNGIALVPEKRHLFYEMNVKENLLMGGIYLKNHKLRKEIDKVYSLFPILKERFHQVAGTLSGGEQQMLAIGRALICNPRVLILDEPCSGMAYKIMEKIFEVIIHLKQKGTTILLIEQNAEVMEIVDYVYAMQTGRIIAQGNPQEVLSIKNIGELFLS